MKINLHKYEFTTDGHVAKTGKGHCRRVGTILVFSPGNPGSILGGNFCPSCTCMSSLMSIVKMSRYLNVQRPVAVLRAGNLISWVNMLLLSGLVMRERKDTNEHFGRGLALEFIRV